MNNVVEGMFIRLASILSLTGAIIELNNIDIDQGIIWASVSALLWVVVLMRLKKG
jgi:hypothetical protein